MFLSTSSVRAIVALNLHSYGSGRHPWGNLKPDYLEKVCLTCQMTQWCLHMFQLCICVYVCMCVYFPFVCSQLLNVNLNVQRLWNDSFGRIS